MVWMFRSSFSHMSAEGHLNGFQFLTITNKAVMNICIQVFYRHVSILSGEMCHNVIAGLYSKCIFSLIRNCQH